MDRFFDNYLLILTTTRDIAVAPFDFGRGIEAEAAEVKRAAIYMGEGVILFYAVYEMLAAGDGIVAPGSGTPYAGEMLAAVLIASSALTGLVVHPVASAFADQPTTVYGSLACFLYWGGFCLFVIPPLFALLILGSQWLFGATALGEGWQLLVMMVVLVPLLFVYYIGTISSWIGHVYGTEAIMGGVAVAIGTTVLFAITSALAGAVSLVVGQNLAATTWFGLG